MRQHHSLKSLPYLLPFLLPLFCTFPAPANPPTTAPAVTQLPKVAILPTAPCRLFTAQIGATVFLQSDARIMTLDPQLVGLNAIQIPTTGGPITLTSRAPVQLLIGFFHGQEPQFAPPPPTTPTIKNAATITNMPPLDVYLVDFKKGKTTLTFPGACVILGVIPASVTIPPHDAAPTSTKAQK